MRCLGIAALLVLVPAMARAASVDVDLSYLHGLVRPSSVVEVRENSVAGTRLPLRQLGVDAVPVPSLDATAWLTDRQGVSAQLRLFAVRGTAEQPVPTNFNGATLPAGTSLHVDPTWYSLGFYYAHRWSSAAARSTEIRGRFGLEYTFINFTIDHGHAPVTATSSGHETREGFYRQEWPLPTAELSARRRLSSAWSGRVVVSGNWVNHLNAHKPEGGTVYLSQRRIEAQLQLVGDGGRFQSWQPEVGLFFFDYRQLETSPEDENLLHLKMWGPNVGITRRF
jgi:hypothetical protein